MTGHWPGSAVRGIDLLLVVLVTTGVLFLMKLLVAGLAVTPGVLLTMLFLQSLVPLAAVYLIVIRGRGIGWSDLGIRAAPRGWYLRAAVFAVLTIPVVAMLNYLVQGLTGEPFRNPQIDILAPTAFSWTSMVGMLILAGVAAPIAEEVVFRGLLYGWLRRHLGVALGAGLSAFAFAVAHGIVILIPALFVVGVIAALMYERSRSLWPPIILHATFNTIMTVTLFSLIAAGEV